MQIATVRYHVATYSGEISVNCADDEDNETVIARARRALGQRSAGGLPFGYQSFGVEKREPVSDEG